jgi:cyclophilin family peptidyl-prolyl cis-trans isomerase
MRTARKSVVAYLMLGGLLAAAGCGSKGDAGTEGKTASINASGPNATDAAGANPAARTPKAPTNPAVSIRTRLGEIVVKLDAQGAPNTTSEFLYYVKKGHYDGTIFHQVIKNQAVVAGQYLRDLTARPGRTAIVNEAAKCSLRNVRFTIAMMRDPDVIDSSTCQFFINVADNPQLDHKGNSPLDFGYCTFGEVIQGFEVVKRISEVAVRDAVRDGRTFDQCPEEPVIIEQVSVVR